MTERISTVDHVDGAELERVLREESRAVLIDFTAAWCGPCQQLAPRLQELAEAEQSRLRVVAVDVDENPLVSTDYGVMAMPTLVLIHNGKRVLEWVGAEDLAPFPAVLDELSSGDCSLPDKSHPERVLDCNGPMPGSIEISPRDGALSRIVVAENHVIHLEIGGREEDLSKLDDLNPNAFDSVHFVRDFTADDLKHLRRFTGLQHMEWWGELKDITIEQIHQAFPATRINGVAAHPRVRRLIPENPEYELDRDPGGAEGVLTATLVVSRKDERRAAAYITLQIAEGYHLVTPVGDASQAVSIALPDGSPWRISSPPVFPVTEDGQLTGSSMVAVDLIGAGGGVDLVLTVQACREDACLRPQTIALSSPVAVESSRRF